MLVVRIYPIEDSRPYQNIKWSDHNSRGKESYSIFMETSYIVWFIWEECQPEPLGQGKFQLMVSTHEDVWLTYEGNHRHLLIQKNLWLQVYASLCHTTTELLVAPVCDNILYTYGDEMHRIIFVCILGMGILI